MANTYPEAHPKPAEASTKTMIRSNTIESLKIEPVIINAPKTEIESGAEFLEIITKKAKIRGTIANTIGEIEVLVGDNFTTILTSWPINNALNN